MKEFIEIAIKTIILVCLGFGILGFIALLINND